MICSIRDIKYDVLQDTKNVISTALAIVCQYNGFEILEKIVREGDSYMYFHRSADSNGHLCIHFSHDHTSATVDLFANGVDNMGLKLIHEFLVDTLNASYSQSLHSIIDC